MKDEKEASLVKENESLKRALASYQAQVALLAQKHSR